MRKTILLSPYVPGLVFSFASRPQQNGLSTPLILRFGVSVWAKAVDSEFIANA
jgi:hypothetical protein